MSNIPSTTRAYRVKSEKCTAEDWPNALNLVEEKVPQLKRNQVLINVKAVSLNYRDIMVLKGLYPGANKDVLLGSDGAGEVVAVGEDSPWQVGDRVMGTFHQTWQDGEITPYRSGHALGALIDGILTNYKILESEGLVKMPDYLSFEEAATLPCAALTAYTALYTFEPLQAGQTVLLLGTGGVSIFALQYVVAAGAKAIITSSSDEKLKKAKAMGAYATVNYKTHPDWEEEVAKLAPFGVDKVLEVGGPGTMHKSIKSLRMGGSIYQIGALSGYEGDAGIAPAILFKSAKLIGLLVGHRASFERMLERLFVPNKIKPSVDKVFPFEQALDAIKHMESGSHFGKVVIKVSE